MDRALPKLLGKLRLEPIERRDESGQIVRGYRFSGELTIELLLSGEAWEVSRNTVVAPTGFDTLCNLQVRGIVSRRAV